MPSIAFRRFSKDVGQSAWCGGEEKHREKAALQVRECVHGQDVDTIFSRASGEAFSESKALWSRHHLCPATHVILTSLDFPF